MVLERGRADRMCSCIITKYRTVVCFVNGFMCMYLLGKKIMYARTENGTDSKASHNLSTFNGHAAFLERLKPHALHHGAHGLLCLR